MDWNHPVKAGSGTITIREGSASGTVVDQFVVGSSSSITIVNNQVILDPVPTLSTGLEYFVTFPAGTIKSFSDKYQNDQLIYHYKPCQPLLFYNINYQSQNFLHSRMLFLPADYQS